MWPDVGIKSIPNVYQNSRKRSRSLFYLKLKVLEKTKKSPIFLGYFCKKICFQKLSKVALIWSHCIALTFQQEWQCRNGILDAGSPSRKAFWHFFFCPELCTRRSSWGTSTTGPRTQTGTLRSTFCPVMSNFFKKWANPVTFSADWRLVWNTSYLHTTKITIKCILCFLNGPFPASFFLFWSFQYSWQ